MKYIALCTALFLPLLASAKKLSFRTDGYYLCDNNQDTVFLLKNNPHEQADLQQQIISMGLNITKNECLPQVGIPIAGSSLITILSFFSDTSGTLFEHNCWTKSTYERTITVLKTRKAAAGTSQEENDQKIYVTLYANNNFRIMYGNPDGMHKTITGTLYKDSIVAVTRLPAFRGFNPPPEKPMTYKFYPYNQCAPLRNHLIFVYRNQ